MEKNVNKTLSALVASIITTASSVPNAVAYDGKDLELTDNCANPQLSYMLEDLNVSLIESKVVKNDYSTIPFNNGSWFADGGVK